jgi:hypothetical protein
VLEHRRTLLKDALLSKDEGALFAIANAFDLRHRNAGQRDDYDEVFLDWVFWWYLGTIELITRLLARPAPTAGGASVSACLHRRRPMSAASMGRRGCFAACRSLP